MTSSILNIGCLCCPIKTTDIEYNCNKIIEILNAVENLLQIAIFPELCLTGSFCGDLYLNTDFQEKCLLALETLRSWTEGKELIIIFGSPFYFNSSVYNCAFVLSNGRYLGIVPKSNLNFCGPDRDYRGFATKQYDFVRKVNLCRQTVPFGQPLLFSSAKPQINFSVEIGADASTGLTRKLSQSGAGLVFNLSALRKTVNSLDYWQNLMSVQSAQVQIGYFMQSGSLGDSSAESVLDDIALGYLCGKAVIPENMVSPSFKLSFFCVDLDIIHASRTMSFNFPTCPEKETQHIPVFLKTIKYSSFKPLYSKEPFLENLPPEFICGRIFEIQSEALLQKLRSFHTEKTVIGVSGGQDSTATLLTIYSIYKKYGLDINNILAVQLPGPGSSKKTINDALNLIHALSLPSVSVNISEGILKNLDQIGHAPDCFDRTYQQTQSRERTRILMDFATDKNALFVGTITLSEIALGWLSYSGDQISMYALNSGIPKSVIPHICAYQANKFPNNIRAITASILNTPISPELLPLDEEGKQNQRTEEYLGSYLVHDFFLYYLLKYNLGFSKIYNMACVAFNGDFNPSQISDWLNIFKARFFTRHYKCACLPEGPQVFGISLSSSMLWEMPGDIEGDLWIK